MLNEIKAIIQQKYEFIESSELLFEEIVGCPEDGLLMMEDSNELAVDDMAATKGTEEESESIPEPGSEKEEEIEAEDKADLEADDVPAASDVAPVGDEPVASEDDGDLLSLTINTSSNTITDVLPIPPTNAETALADDDIMSARIDDGFDGNVSEPVISSNDGVAESFEDDDLLSVPLTKESMAEEGDLFDEAIDLGGDTEAALAEDAPADGGEEKSADGGKDTTVTSAVKDAVSEVEEPSMDEDFGGGSGMDNEYAKKLQEKIAKLQKDLTDTSLLVSKHLTTKS